MIEQIKVFFSHRESALLIIILLFSLLMRLGLIFTVTEPIDRDAKEYYDIAQNLVAGNGFSINGVDPTARRSPGYPAVLAGVIAIFGSAPQTLYIFQALINVLTIFLVYLSLKYVGVKSPLRLFVVLLFSFSTSFIYVNVLYAEILTMFVVVLVLFTTVHPKMQSRQFLKSLLTGLLLGFLIYLRPTFLYLPIFILTCIVIIKIFNCRFQIRNYLLIVGIALLTVAPWTIRNYVVFRQVIPLVSAGGGELWGANFEIAERIVWNSVSDIQKYEDQRTANHTLQNRLISEYRQKYNLETPEGLNRFLSRQGKAIILAHPFRYALLSINRLMIFWFSPPIGSATLKSVSPVLFVVILLIKYSLTILAIFGLWKFARRDFSGAFVWIVIILYLTLLHSATHAIQRYFLPVIPLVYFALGYYLDSLKSKTGARRG